MRKTNLLARSVVSSSSAIIRVICIVIAIGSFSTAKSQTKLDLNTSITSRHYWRGIMVSNSANIETNFEVSNSKFSFGAWGGYALDNNYSEFDLHMDYKISRQLSISAWDLYASRDRASIDEYKYFNFNRKSTNHLVDVTVKYTIAPSFPLSLSWSSMVWGRDLDKDGNQNYSSYMEFSYPVEFHKTDIQFFLGSNVFENSIYGKHIGIVNAGLTATRKIKVNEKLEIPIWGTIAINPEAETANLILGINL